MHVAIPPGVLGHGKVSQSVIFFCANPQLATAVLAIQLDGFDARARAGNPKLVCLLDSKRIDIMVVTMSLLLLLLLVSYTSSIVVTANHIQ